MHTAYYETIDNKTISDEKQFIKNYIHENNLNQLISKAKINLLDKKVFFKLMCQMLEKAEIKI